MTDYAKMIDSVFTRFGLDAHVDSFTTGPSVTRYSVALGRGVKVNKVSALRDEIAYACAAQSVRIGLIPGKSAVGVELPNDERKPVRQDEIPAGGATVIGIGKDIEGQMVTADLTELPHLLVAGTTSSGKSSFINSALVTLLKAEPSAVQLVLIDVKQIELTPYQGVAHLRQPIITETDDAVMALRELCDEMDSRFETMKVIGTRNIDDLGVPRIIVVVDELADLIGQAKTAADYLTRLAQKARAAGIHLLLSTQRPSADVIPSRLKTNLPSRLGFAVASATDSRVVMDESGCEQLLGKGDGLYRPIDAREAIRIQGALVTDEEIAEAVRKAAKQPVQQELIGNPDGLPAQRVGLSDILRKAERAARDAHRYLTWIPTYRGRTDEANTRLQIELNEAHEALAEIAAMLRAEA